MPNWPGGVTERLEQLGDGRVFLPAAERGAGEPDLGQAGTDAVLASDERRRGPRCSFARVVIGELHALLGETVDVRRAVTHQAVV